ncbi:hypothetical protein D5086_028822 [Populus alba]|uniref:Uncharacterized protein n=1 Tax=Populus alba TaxID=43335 RepID=A0ACC4ARQ0_POPAL
MRYVVALKPHFLVPYIDYVRNPTKKMELWAGYCSGDYKGLVIGEGKKANLKNSECGIANAERSGASQNN